MLSTVFLFQPIKKDAQSKDHIPKKERTEETSTSTAWKIEIPQGVVTGSWLKRTYIQQGVELFQKVESAKILVVGAGGIGCELLKNLELSGFADIEVMDVDTIDASN